MMGKERFPQSWVSQKPWRVVDWGAILKEENEVSSKNIPHPQSRGDLAGFAQLISEVFWTSDFHMPTILPYSFSGECLLLFCP